MFTTENLEDGDIIQALFGNVYCLPELEEGASPREEEGAGWKEVWQSCPIIGVEQNQVGEPSSGLLHASDNLCMAVRADCLIPHIRHATEGVPANCQWVYNCFTRDQFEGRKKLPGDTFSYRPTHERILEGRSFIRAINAIPVPANGKVELILEVNESLKELCPQPLVLAEDYFTPDEEHFFDDGRMWTKSKDQDEGEETDETDGDNEDEKDEKDGEDEEQAAEVAGNEHGKEQAAEVERKEDGEDRAAEVAGNKDGKEQAAEAEGNEDGKEQGTRTGPRTRSGRN